MQRRVSNKLYKIYCDKCKDYLGSFVSGTQAKCPECNVYSSAKINDSENRKEDTR